MGTVGRGARMTTLTPWKPWPQSKRIIGDLVAGLRAASRERLPLRDANGKPSDKGYSTVLLERVPGTVWAVTQHYVGYQVTHLPTTFRVASFTRRAHAQRVARALAHWVPRYRADGSVPTRDKATPLDLDVLAFVRWAQS